MLLLADLGLLYSHSKLNDHQILCESKEEPPRVKSSAHVEVLQHLVHLAVAASDGPSVCFSIEEPLQLGACRDVFEVLKNLLQVAVKMVHISDTYWRAVRKVLLMEQLDMTPEIVRRQRRVLALVRRG